MANKADLLEAWGGHLAEGRRRSPHTVRAYVATAGRLLDSLGESDWHRLAALDAGRCAGISRRGGRTGSAMSRPRASFRRSRRSSSSRGRKPG
ncbi:site-specific integrase [Novosphingobium resinovorum]